MHVRMMDSEGKGSTGKVGRAADGGRQAKGREGGGKEWEAQPARNRSALLRASSLHRIHNSPLHGSRNC